VERVKDDRVGDRVDATHFAADLRTEAQHVIEGGWTDSQLEGTNLLGARAVMDPASVADADEVWANVQWSSEGSAADCAAGFARTRRWFESVRD